MHKYVFKHSCPIYSRNQVPACTLLYVEGRPAVAQAAQKLYETLPRARSIHNGHAFYRKTPYGEAERR